MLPPDGVYAVRVIIGAERLGGVVNIGVRPTFVGAQPRRVLEVHILDFARDLYAQDVEVCFLSKFATSRNLFRWTRCGSNSPRY